ncbi:MAG: G/U mismatch-specific DNA glycosylase [Elusimicrobia bacterium]|nr:G/U mismatch-specific DNA glycosylase [Elusimicrobiota bacterium]
MAVAPPTKPTRADLLAAKGKTVPDIVAPGLRCLFVGINPGLYTAAIGHHFGRPGNRFWPALHAGGFTPRLFSPYEEAGLLDFGVGITNLVARATATADEVSGDELREGGKVLVRKIQRYKPRAVAILGIVAYRAAFGRKDSALGPQTETLGEAGVWVLPNPSGLNAHFQAADFGRLFTDLRRWTEKR